MNKCKSPKIPPILINNIFVLNAKEKANEFIKYFSAQCTPLVNDSTLPNLSYHTEQRLNHLEFTREDILSLIRNLNKNKSCGHDGISARMLSICDISLVVPLKLIFSNILATGVFPEISKRANVTPIHKKGSKQLVKNYRPISLLPICSKLFEKIVFKYLHN